MVESTSAADQARQKLVQIAREIQRLADSPLPVPDFFRQFLKLIISALGAKGGGIWLKGPDGRITMVAEQGLADAGLAEQIASNENQTLLQETFGTGQARCVVQETENGDASAGGLIILAPLHRNEECAGVIELFQRANTPEQARKGYLQFAEQMSGYASRFLQNLERQRSSAATDPFWKELNDLTYQMQTTRQPQEVAMVAANDGRLMLKCDRISILCRRGRTLRTEAVSGLEAVNHRSNLVRAMNRLADHVLPLKRTFTYSGNVDELPAALKAPLADFVAESGCRTLTIVPLFEPDPLLKPDGIEDSHDSRDQQTPFGCIVIEQLSEKAESSTRDELAERSSVLAEHVAAALANARAFQRIFLRPLFVKLGNCREYLFGRHLLKTTVALPVLAVVVAAMVFVKWEYRVEAEGKMMPSERAAVFAPWDGRIAEVYVKGGAAVTKGDRLLRIRNDELHEELVNVRNTLAEKRQELRKLRAEVDDVDGRLQPDEKTRLQGQLAETQATIRGLTEREAILDAREKRLTLVAPITGVIATFRVEELLDRRPVQRGEVLMEIMNDKGEWRLELDVEEHRMGHVLRAQQAVQSGNLPLEFVLATSPEETYLGTMRTISTRPKRIADRGSLVEVFGTIKADQPLNYRIGAEVRAKIDCGERRLGYVLFGDVIEFVRGRWWF